MDECLYYYPLWETTLGGDCITLMCFASVLFTCYSIFSQSCVLHYDGKTASTKNATTIFWLWDKKDQIQSCWKEFAICVSIMSVKILEKANAWQVDRFGHWHLLCGHGTGTVGLKATPASPHHLANTSGDCLEASLSRVSGCFCLYVHSHLCLGCQEEWPPAWDMPWVVGSVLQSATALPQHRPTHRHCCLHHGDPPAGKRKSSLVSYQLYEQFGQTYSQPLISY